MISSSYIFRFNTNIFGAFGYAKTKNSFGIVLEAEVKTR